MPALERSHHLKLLPNQEFKQHRESFKDQFQSDVAMLLANPNSMTEYFRFYVVPFFDQGGPQNEDTLSLLDHGRAYNKDGLTKANEAKGWYHGIYTTAEALDKNGDVIARTDCKLISIYGVGTEENKDPFLRGIVTLNERENAVFAAVNISQGGRVIFDPKAFLVSDIPTTSTSPDSPVAA